ncbi:MAG: hypothetical protein AB1894_16810 [Chloroflexota bacterium]
MKNSWIIFGLIALLLAAILVCSCLLGSIGALTLARRYNNQPVVLATFPPPPATNVPSPTSVPLDPTPTFETSAPTLVSPAVTPTTSAAPKPGEPLLENLKLLENTTVPINDPIELAERLGGKTNLPVSLQAPARQYQIDDQTAFWVTNGDTNQSSQVQATLRYSTDHVYFWIEDGVTYNQRSLRSLVDTFEDKIYPTNRAFFGSEWIPGVDGDPHMYILYTTGLGSSVAGYFSSADEYLPQVREDSNGHEMFLLSADHVDLEEEFAYSVLAHEFQHMIHWYRDRNEETWMNEGFSELASFLNGYDPGGADRVFVRDVDIQLTDWPNSSSNRSAHYGASFLFMTYFLDRFGEEVTQSLVANPANGMRSIDLVLSDMGITDPQTGETITADDVFADWVVASYLQDSRVDDGRFTYSNYPSAPRPSYTEEVPKCPYGPTQFDVSQYGVDYLRITCRGDYTLNFEGFQQVNLLPADPHSGAYAFYSNMGDESDMTLTRAFDFSDQTGPLTLSYWTWYDLEKDYDYLYLVASEDEGVTWQILTTPSGTDEDVSGNSYGWGYNGWSGGGPEWIQETLDISQFAGKNILLRFEYITDAAVNGEGFLVDDIAIPEIDYFTDFESDEGGWQADGFVRIENVLPQNFILTLIQIGNKTSVERIPLTAENSAQMQLHIGQDVDEVILVVSGATPFTRQKALYQISIQP